MRITAEAVENAAQAIDVRRRDASRAAAFAHPQGSLAADDGVPRLLECKAHQALRHPACRVENVEEQVALGRAADLAVLGDVPPQPGGILGREIACRLGLVDDVIGDGFDEAIGPGRILDGAGVVERQDGLGFFSANTTILVVAAPQLQNVCVLDAPPRLDFRDRNRAQYAHGKPPTNSGRQAKPETVTSALTAAPLCAGTRSLGATREAAAPCLGRPRRNVMPCEI